MATTKHLNCVPTGTPDLASACPTATARQYTPTRAAKTAANPSVLIPTRAVRPGYSSGFTPTRPSQKKVREKPSNETEDSASRMKATPLAGKTPASSRRMPGTVAKTTRRPPSLPAPKGDSHETMRKKIEKISPWRSQASRPNSSVPAAVIRK